MTVLAIGSHPDDIELGCGGTIVKHIRNKDKVVILILSKGRVQKDQILEASNLLGVTGVFVMDFIAQEFIQNEHKIAECIAGYVDRYQPDTVYTHSNNDLNLDHKVAHTATLIACRGNRKYRPSKLYAYEVMGSNLNPFSSFQATHFVDIDLHMDAKITAMGAYIGEIKKYPQPRSVGGILICAEYQGLQCGLKYAEGFETVFSLDL